MILFADFSLEQTVLMTFMYFIQEIFLLPIFVLNVVSKQICLIIDRA